MKTHPCYCRGLGYADPPLPATASRYPGPAAFGQFPFKCSGRFPVLVSIVDWLRVPKDTPPGEYVLGFRYDCEMTSQVWSSCADIQIA